MSHKATAGAWSQLPHGGHTAGVLCPGTQEQEIDEFPSTAFPPLGGIALSMAAAMGAVWGTDPGARHQGPSTHPCVLGMGTAATAQGIGDTARVLSLPCTCGATELLGPCSKPWKLSSQTPKKLPKTRPTNQIIIYTENHTGLVLFAFPIHFPSFPTCAPAAGTLHASVSICYFQLPG